MREWVLNSNNKCVCSCFCMVNAFRIKIQILREYKL